MKKNLITVLKKLLAAFGGNSEIAKNNAVDIIDEIANSASSAQSAAAQTAQAQAEAAAAVANKAEVYRFTVNRPVEVGASGESLDYTQWTTPFQDLLAALDDTKKVPVLSIRYETDIQHVYSTTIQVVPTIEKKDQDTIILSWFNVPAAGSPVYTRLVVDAATELATYYEYVISGGGGVEPVVVTITPTSEIAGTWSGATWEELVNAYYHGCAFALDSESEAVLPINGLLIFENGAAVGMNFYNMEVTSLGVIKITITLGNDNTFGINQSQYPSSITP